METDKLIILGTIAVAVLLTLVLMRWKLGKDWPDRGDKIARIVGSVVAVVAAVIGLVVTTQHRNPVLPVIDTVQNVASSVAPPPNSTIGTETRRTAPGDYTAARGRAVKVLRGEVTVLLYGVQSNQLPATADLKLSRQGWNKNCRARLGTDTPYRFLFRDKLYELTVTELQIEDQTVRFRVAEAGPSEGYSDCDAAAPR